MINLCVLGCPLPPYIKEQGEGGRPLGRAKEGGVLLLIGVGLPFPSPTRKREGEGKRGRGKEGPRPPPLVLFGLPLGGGRAPSPGCCPLSPLRPTKAHYFPGGSGNPFSTPVLLETYPEHFPCPNNMVQYINLYVSTISRLLVMSMISSGTPNNLRYIKSHNS